MPEAVHAAWSRRRLCANRDQDPNHRLCFTDAVCPPGGSGLVTDISVTISGHFKSN